MSKTSIHTDLLTHSFQGTKGLSNICFLGIGGIGMSALARYFASAGVKVVGYDKTSTSLTRELEDAGIDIHYEDDLSKVEKNADLVIYTPAIPADHQELNWYQSQGYKVWKRSDVLQHITADALNVCIAGTHGKTTTTTMVAHILRDSGFGCNAFLGGIAANYGTNYWGSTTNCCVVEADEYDRSFLKLRPQIALISAMDPDHLDIYGTAAAMEEAFIDFSALIQEGGLLIYKYGLPRAANLKGPVKWSYHLDNAAADCYASGLQVKGGSYHFEVIINGEKLGPFELSMGGLHNVENAVGAISIAYALGIESSKIANAIASFKGVQRRFEKIVEKDGLVLIDDYAHHPAELSALIKGVRSLYGENPCTLIFQPHLYSRTKDLATEFAEALDLADKVVLLPIYPARELPIAGVDSDMIAKKMKREAMQLNVDELLSWIQYKYLPAANKSSNVLVTAGAGNIDQLPMAIKKLVEKN
jgi:UDP-N-acetylmuramate--alanine ligase